VGLSCSLQMKSPAARTPERFWRGEKNAKKRLNPYGLAVGGEGNVQKKEAYLEGGGNWVQPHFSRSFYPESRCTSGSRAFSVSRGKVRESPFCSIKSRAFRESQRDKKTLGR